MGSKKTFPVIQPKFPTHPGKILKDVYMTEYGLSTYELANNIGVPQSELAKILHENCRVSADIDLRLSKFFGMTQGMWLNLQNTYDLKEAQIKICDELKRITPIGS